MPVPILPVPVDDQDWVTEASIFNPMDGIRLAINSHMGGAVTGTNYSDRHNHSHIDVGSLPETAGAGTQAPANQGVYNDQTYMLLSKWLGYAPSGFVAKIAQVGTNTYSWLVAFAKNHTHQDANNGGQLNWAYTHLNGSGNMSPPADADTSAAAVHHTLGTGANQAAAGNHLHTGVYAPVGGAGTSGTWPISVSGNAATASTAAAISANGVSTASLQDGAVTSAKIQDGTIVGTDIAPNTITSGNILDGTITGTDIAPSTITSANILDGTIVAADLADGSILSTKQAAGRVIAKGSLLVDINGFMDYPLDFSRFISYAGQLNYDLSSYVPGVTNNRHYILIALDVNGLIAVKSGNLTTGTAVEPAPDADTTPLAAILLQFGQTSIDQTQVLDRRASLRRVGATAGGGGGSGGAPADGQYFTYATNSSMTKEMVLSTWLDGTTNTAPDGTDLSSWRISPARVVRGVTNSATLADYVNNSIAGPYLGSLKPNGTYCMVDISQGPLFIDGGSLGARMLGSAQTGGISQISTATGGAGTNGQASASGSGTSVWAVCADFTVPLATWNAGGAVITLVNPVYSPGPGLVVLGRAIFSGPNNAFVYVSHSAHGVLPGDRLSQMTFCTPYAFGNFLTTTASIINSSMGDYYFYNAVPVKGEIVLQANFVTGAAGATSFGMGLGVDGTLVNPQLSWAAQQAAQTIQTYTLHVPFEAATNNVLQPGLHRFTFFQLISQYSVMPSYQYCFLRGSFSAAGVLP